MGLDGKEGGEELAGLEGGINIIRVYNVQKILSVKGKMFSYSKSFTYILRCIP